MPARFEDQVLALLGPLHGVARRLTSSEAEAEDLVAEAIARAWRARETLQEPRAFRAWMFRILHNTFLSERRRPGARFEVASAPNEADDGDEPFSLFERLHQPFLLWFGNPEQEFLDRLLRDSLDRALDALPEHHRIVVLLSDLEELTYAEIAEVLEIPVGTVRSRLFRARAALQKLLWQTGRDYGLAACIPARPADAGPQPDTKDPA